MKKTLMLITLIAAIMACNNSTDSSDKPGQPGNAGGQNGTVADSAAARQGGDTSSYEHMPNKISDSTNQ